MLLRMVMLLKLGDKIKVWDDRVETVEFLGDRANLGAPLYDSMLVGTSCSAGDNCVRFSLHDLVQVVGGPADAGPRGEDLRPKNCRHRLKDENKMYPKSGCEVSGCAGVFGALCRKGA